MKLLRAAAAAVLALILAACAAPGGRIAPAESFDVLGRVLVSGEGRGFSSGFRWRSDSGVEEFWLLSPVGQTLAHILADGSGAVLTTPDQQEYRDRSAEALTRRALGWALPLAELGHWMQALPVPEVPATVEADSSGRLLQMEQAGWTVRFGYADAAPRPRRLDLSREGQQIRLVIDERRAVPAP